MDAYKGPNCYKLIHFGQQCFSYNCSIRPGFLSAPYSAAENFQREDLSAIEMIEAVVEIVDGELIKDQEYAPMMEWLSFLNHDLPLAIDFCKEVKKVSVQHGLNSFQTRALEVLKRASSEEFQRVTANDQNA